MTEMTSSTYIHVVHIRTYTHTHTHTHTHNVYVWVNMTFNMTWQGRGSCPQTFRGFGERKRDVRRWSLQLLSGQRLTHTIQTWQLGRVCPSFPPTLPAARMVCHMVIGSLTFPCEWGSSEASWSHWNRWTSDCWICVNLFAELNNEYQQWTNLKQHAHLLLLVLLFIHCNSAFFCLSLGPVTMRGAARLQQHTSLDPQTQRHQNCVWTCPVSVT